MEGAVYVCFGGFATRFDRVADERAGFPPRDMGRVTFAVGAVPFFGPHEDALVGKLVNEPLGLVDPYSHHSALPAGAP
jgi:hypothetical protein